jgi:hypothetical protein
LSGARYASIYLTVSQGTTDLGVLPTTIHVTASTDYTVWPQNVATAGAPIPTKDVSWYCPECIGASDITFEALSDRFIIHNISLSGTKTVTIKAQDNNCSAISTTDNLKLTLISP